MNCYLFSCFFFPTCPLLLSFLLLFFLLVHCYFLSCYFFSCYFFPTWNCYFLSCYLFSCCFLSVHPMGKLCVPHEEWLNLGMPDSSVLASTLILRVGVLARGPRTILVLYINLFRQTDWLEQRCVVRGIALSSLLSCRLPANLNSRGSSVAPPWAHLCWPGSRSVHGSIHSCVIGRPRFARRGHPKYCLGCLARSHRPPSVNKQPAAQTSYPEPARRSGCHSLQNAAASVFPVMQLHSWVSCCICTAAFPGTQLRHLRRQPFQTICFYCRLMKW